MDRSELASLFTFYDSDSDSYAPVNPAILKQTLNTSSATSTTCQRPSFTAADQPVESDSTRLYHPGTTDRNINRTANKTAPTTITTTTTTSTAATTTVFSPIQMDRGHILQVSVTTPQHLPCTGSTTMSAPFCTVCGAFSRADGSVTTGVRRPARTAFSTSASNSSMSSSSSSCTSSTSLNSQSDGLYPGSMRDNGQTILDAWLNTTHPVGGAASGSGGGGGCRAPSYLGLPTSSTVGSGYSCSSYKETVKSPMVVMTDVKNNFFSGDGWANSTDQASATDFYRHIPLLGPEFDVSGSGSSTLTKKSRIGLLTVDGSSDTANVAASSPTPPPASSEFFPVSDLSKRGTMDKVIDKFTLLNVQRDEANSAGGVATVPTTVVPAAANGTTNGTFLPPLEPLPMLPAPVDLRADTTINTSPALNDALSVVPADPSTTSTTTTKSTADSGPRVSRRRNASSICMGAWSSWTRDTTPFFNRRTGLPLQSSPVPLKRSTSGKFDFDASLCPLKLSKSSICMAFGTDSRPEPSPTSPLAVSNNVALERNVNSAKADCDSSTTESVRTKVCTTTTDTSAHTTTAPSQSRRRPASLRLNVPPPVYSSDPVSSVTSSPVPPNSATEKNGHHSGRRRACPSGSDSHFPHHHHPRHHYQQDHHHHHQAEMSCSAPPSGNRSLHMISDRLANTMAGTPVSHASSQHLLVNFEVSPPLFAWHFLSLNS
ncbi:unnamed protein product [Echinostoma caproni]|uniref:Protein kinase domain-containing protein n=1 Tax=Echinostoma caproni TaxID=27848 RepID=A0A183AU39_9TREM|nr:unnamed protein product [Echinostoma caproni]